MTSSDLFLVRRLMISLPATQDILLCKTRSFGIYRHRMSGIHRSSNAPESDDRSCLQSPFTPTTSPVEFIYAGPISPLPSPNPGDRRFWTVGHREPLLGTSHPEGAWPLGSQRTPHQDYNMYIYYCCCAVGRRQSVRGGRPETPTILDHNRNTV